MLSCDAEDSGLRRCVSVHETSEAGGPVGTEDPFSEFERRKKK